MFVKYNSKLTDNEINHYQVKVNKLPSDDDRYHFMMNTYYQMINNGQDCDIIDIKKILGIRAQKDLQTFAVENYNAQFCSRCREFHPIEAFRHNRSSITGTGYYHQCYTVEQIYKTSEAGKARDQRFREKHKNDIYYWLTPKLTSHLRKTLKDRSTGKNGDKTEELLGYTKDSYIKAIEKTLPWYMTLERALALKWELDHIIPGIIFKITSNSCQSLLDMYHPDNLRLILPAINRSKQDKLADTNRTRARDLKQTHDADARRIGHMKYEVFGPPLPGFEHLGYYSEVFDLTQI
jgi:hypothetical protein